MYTPCKSRSDYILVGEQKIKLFAFDTSKLTLKGKCRSENNLELPNDSKSVITSGRPTNGSESNKNDPLQSLISYKSKGRKTISINIQYKLIQLN